MATAKEKTMEWFHELRFQQELQKDEKFCKQLLQKFPQSIMYMDKSLQDKFAQEVAETDKWWALKECKSEVCQNIYIEKALQNI